MNPSYRIVLWDDNTYTVQQRRAFFWWVDASSHMPREESARETLALYEEIDEKHRQRRQRRIRYILPARKP